MSNSITISLMTKRRENSKKMATRAAELLKEKNCDWEFELFDADDGSCSGIGIAELYGEASGVVQRVIEGVVASFPDIEMREQVSANGELIKEYISENGKLTEVEIIDEEETRIMALRNCSIEEFKELLCKARQAAGPWPGGTLVPAGGLSCPSGKTACCCALKTSRAPLPSYTVHSW